MNKGQNVRQRGREGHKSALYEYTYRVLCGILRPFFTEKLHVLWHDEVNSAGDEVENCGSRVLRLTVDIYHFRVAALDLEVGGAHAGYVLRVVLVAALGIAHDYAQQLRAVDAGGDEHVHDAVVGPCVVRGVESAAVVAPVADADQVEFRPAR